MSFYKYAIIIFNAQITQPLLWLLSRWSLYLEVAGSNLCEKGKLSFHATEKNVPVIGHDVGMLRLSVRP